MQEAGYMESVMLSLRPNERRDFPLDGINVQSWRTVASRQNKKAGYTKYSIIESHKLGIFSVKCNEQPE